MRVKIDNGDGDVHIFEISGDENLWIEVEEPYGLGEIKSDWRPVGTLWFPTKDRRLVLGVTVGGGDWEPRGEIQFDEFEMGQFDPEHLNQDQEMS